MHFLLGLLFNRYYFEDLLYKIIAIIEEENHHSEVEEDIECKIAEWEEPSHYVGKAEKHDLESLQTHFGKYLHHLIRNGLQI